MIWIILGQLVVYCCKYTNEDYKWILPNNPRDNPSRNSNLILYVLPLKVSKITEPAIYTYNIVIYGDTIDTAMLAYHIDQQISK